MEVAYLFCEDSLVRIPVINYDKRLFNTLLTLNNRVGYWDNEKKEFRFKREEKQAELSRKKFENIFNIMPSVWIEETKKPQVFGFLDREWNKSAYQLSERKEKKSKKDYALEDEKKTLPDKFSEYWQAKLDLEMRARKFSAHTRSTYSYYNRLLCRILQKTPEDMLSEDVTKLLASMERTEAYSASTMNLALSSVKFFYRNVMKSNITKEHFRPRQDKKLPLVLSKNEIVTLLKMEKNLKHRLLMMLVYSSGLRVSEVVSLKRIDLDIDRKSISVIAGKGRKDRYTLMSETILEIICEYYDQYAINEDDNSWVFTGQEPSSHLSIRSAQHIFEKAVKNANIKKDVSIHCLRHSFATHLLENGTDIRYIQELLGHSSIRTTERYTHVARRKVLKIKSPLDTVNEPDD